MGMCKREQPLRCKESIRPQLIVTFPSTTTAVSTFAQDAAQTHPEPLVQRRKRRVVAMFEIPKPASRDQIDARDDYLQASPVVALGKHAQLVLEFLQALAARPFIATL